MVIAIAMETLLFSPAQADELAFPKGVEQQEKIVDGSYHFERPVSGSGVLMIQWTDVYGRLVERLKIVLNLKQVSEIPFHLDMRRAVAMQNELQTDLTLDEVTKGGPTIHRNDVERLSFVVSPPKQVWSDYQIIMWQPHGASQDAGLKKLGISAGMLEGRHLDDRSLREEAPLLQNNLPWYVENIATDFYSPYHHWFPNHPVNWLFLAAEKHHQEQPNDISAFIRDPSLSDPQWLKRIHDRLVKTVEGQRVYSPLFYDLGDETGIADLSASWDFDFSESSLRGMREWLKTRYHTLTALNAEWGTNFDSWNAVSPATTEATFRRPDQNFSAWSDFKEWMDVAFARAIRMGTEAVHSADGKAYAAIEGGQGPGTGGYDYTRLAHSVDLMELYDIRHNVDIVHSLNPRTVILTTSFQSGLTERHRVWQELFEGTRGLILWDDTKKAFVKENGKVGSRGRAAAKYFNELRDGLGSLLINSTRRTDGIDILYSPASMRIEWMLDQRARIAAGENVSMSRGSKGDPITSSVGWFTETLAHMGLAPRIVSPELVEQGALRDAGSRVMILPYAIALSPQETREIQKFARRGGVIIADDQPGLFDQHGRRLPKPLLEDLFRGQPSAATVNKTPRQGGAFYLDISSRSSDGAVVHGVDATQRLANSLKAAGVEAPFPFRGAADAMIGDVRTYLYDNGNVEILALQRDLGGRLSDLGKEHVTLGLPHHSFIYDLRREEALGKLNRIDLALNGYDPAIFALSPTALPAPVISGPTHLKVGQLGHFLLGFSSKPSAAQDIIHLDVVGPDGSVISYYSGNILLREAASKLLPIALNDPPGKWTICATDVMSGQSAALQVDISGPP